MCGRAPWITPVTVRTLFRTRLSPRTAPILRSNMRPPTSTFRSGSLGSSVTKFRRWAAACRSLKNGWGFDSTLTLQGGQPFQFNYNCEDDFSGGGDGYDRPDVVGPITYNYRNPYQFMPLTSFAIPCTTASARRPAAAAIASPERVTSATWAAILCVVRLQGVGLCDS